MRAKVIAQVPILVKINCIVAQVSMHCKKKMQKNTKKLKLEVRCRRLLLTGRLAKVYAIHHTAKQLAGKLPRISPEIKKKM
jgi:hypothetical protein